MGTPAPFPHPCQHGAPPLRQPRRPNPQPQVYSRPAVEGDRLNAVKSVSLVSGLPPGPVVSVYFRKETLYAGLARSPRLSRNLAFPMPARVQDQPRRRTKVTSTRGSHLGFQVACRCCSLLALAVACSFASCHPVRTCCSLSHIPAQMVRPHSQP